jgi:hypothetical protein
MKMKATTPPATAATSEPLVRYATPRLLFTDDDGRPSNAQKVKLALSALSRGVTDYQEYWSHQVKPLGLVLLGTVVLWRIRSWFYPASSSSMRWRRRPSSSPRAEAERHRRRDQRVAAARQRFFAGHHGRDDHDGPQQQQSTTPEAVPKSPTSSNEESAIIESTAPAAGRRPNDKNSKNDQSNKGAWRQATIAEQARYREERASMEHFGFSIYGTSTTEYCVDCVPADPTSSAAAAATFGTGIHKVTALPDLPGAQQVYRELERLRDEFDPIVQARGWKVLALQELSCCAGDSGNHGATKKIGRRDNGSNHGDETIMGYCVGRNDDRVATSIHIRCRVVGSCTAGLRLYPYDELVRTMVRAQGFLCSVFSSVRSLARCCCWFRWLI